MEEDNPATARGTSRGRSDSVGKRVYGNNQRKNESTLSLGMDEASMNITPRSGGKASKYKILSGL